MLFRDKAILGFFLFNAAICGAYLYRVNNPAVVFTLTEFSTAQVQSEPIRWLGSSNAPNKIVVFGDYECPPCAQASKDVHRIVSKFPDKVSYGFKNFPLPQHKYANKLALLIESIKPEAKYWEVHDRVYENRGLITEDIFTKIKKSIDPDSSNNVQAKIVIDQQAALTTKLGLNSTPTIFLCTKDGRVLQFFFSEELEKFVSSIK